MNKKDAGGKWRRICAIMEDEQVLRVYVNGPKSVFLELQETFVLSDVTFDGVEQVIGLVQALGERVGRKLSGEEHAAHFRLGDGKRIAMFRPPGAAAPLLCVSR